ncbi:MAG: SIS domain-containing protein [Desulfobacteraceae bacterium]|nr:SIS domain-containing protein [Desulfobacteraceae bacterium]
MRSYLDSRLPRRINPGIRFGKWLHRVPQGSLVFFPCRQTILGCGLAGIVAYKRAAAAEKTVDAEALEDWVDRLAACHFGACRDLGTPVDRDTYLAGTTTIHDFFEAVRQWKRPGPFYRISTDASLREALKALVRRLEKLIEQESTVFQEQMGRLSVTEVEAMGRCLEDLKDIAWCLRVEILENIDKVRKLFPDPESAAGERELQIFRNVNAVLNSIDRLEVRGRDSAGISLLFVIDRGVFDGFKEALEQANLWEEFDRRSRSHVLLNRGIAVCGADGSSSIGPVAVSVTYKIASEIGSLGDNVTFLRWQMRNDPILHALVGLDHRRHTVLSHTRWASVGAITEANCHPVDNRTNGDSAPDRGIIHVCLNGDIDNYIELKTALQAQGFPIPSEITSDTKIIPLQMQDFLQQGLDVEEAFRRSVNRFEGSHAICMHTDLAPGKLFLAQRGSGQTLFIGLAEDHYMPASEVYGFVEETSKYLKLDGEKIAQGKDGPTQGQIYILDQDAADRLGDIRAMYYDGTPIDVGPDDIKQTEITSRDIDRQDFPHYFLKEISEAPASVEKTLQNRWKVAGDGSDEIRIALDEKTFPASLKTALSENRIRRIFFIGQGTAGVAALACANILEHYLSEPNLQVAALKASEFSGFKIKDGDSHVTMSDALVVAISQSGTTTDTNRTVDMIRERGAHTLAIVNRRDSDLTFKVDGVLYTSSGRDIEMSVASTKAFYSQIVAGALLGLHITSLLGRCGAAFVTQEIQRLLALPAAMRTILALQDDIRRSARRLATGKTYWAAVGSGPNRASADEIRIKLSELCYKTISSDFVEDKKHIDLSSEPLIMVCAAGTRPAVIGDIVKDTAIFKAHKATPIVIADEGEKRFSPYAEDVFHVPRVEEHLAPIVNTLVGHLWGYYAALTINDGSRFFFDFRESLQKTVDAYAEQGLDVFELVLETGFREKIMRFYREFQKRRKEARIPRELGLESAADLTLLFKYLTGRLPVLDFEIDFGVKGTALNMLNTLFSSVGEAINAMARPVDAIKHQAKTVTVGTSRISEKVEGLLFDALTEYGIAVSQLSSKNIIVLRNLQAIVSRIEGAILYRIEDLDLLGDPTETTTIEVVKKAGSLKPIPSRVETDNRLKGTKRIIVREKNVYIGKGKKDDRSIIVIPVNGSLPSQPNTIANLLLLNIDFQERVELPAKIKALGGKYERIQNIVQENSVAWQERYLEMIPMKDLFGISAEKIADRIVQKVG